MSSSSPAQHRWIGWVDHNPAALAHTGLSHAKADEWLHADRGSPWRHSSGGGVAAYDTGGNVDPATGGIGGLAPSSATMNPMTQNMVQRYSSLPPEKLQELLGLVGNSPQGQVIRAVLQQKRTMPNAQPQQVANAPQPTQQKRGGPVRRALGGDMGISPSQASPWWVRSEARGADAGGGGFLAGATPGRADSVQTTAPAGAYVWPADVIAGLGEGNSLAGARVLQDIISSGPYGTPVGRQGPSRGFPHAPQMQARGGATQGGAPEHVPVALSDGEGVTHPDDVRRWGRGNLALGHKIFDHIVKYLRAKHIKELQSLPGPVKAAA